MRVNLSKPNSSELKAIRPKGQLGYTEGRVGIKTKVEGKGDGPAGQYSG